MQIIRCEHACLVQCVLCGCWSLIIGTFGSSDLERSASQNTTTSTVVTTTVEKAIVENTGQETPGNQHQA